MRIESIDNCYEDDGLVLVQQALTRLHAAPDGPDRPRLVAILPEYGVGGRLDRLNVCTVPAEDPEALSEAQAGLMTAADRVVAELQAARRARVTAPPPRPEA